MKKRRHYLKLFFTNNLMMEQKEIEMFIRAWQDFMEHAEQEIDDYHDRQEMKMFYERQAEKLEITVDYYLSEFII